MDVPKPPQFSIPPKKPGGAVPPPLPPSGRRAPVPPKPGIGNSAKPVIKDSSEIISRLDRIEEKSSGVVDSRNMLEEQLKQLEQRLHEEHEKNLLTNIRSKEEAALSSRVEISLKEMQEKLDREQKTSELEAAYQRAQERIGEIEQRMNAERETWVKTLHEQVSGRDLQEQETELLFSQKLSAIEKIWQNEKEELSVRIRNLEEQLEQGKMRSQTDIEKKQVESERSLHERMRDFERTLHEEKERSLQYKRERDMVSEKLTDSEQDFMTLKAQLALIHSQVKLEKEKLNQTWATTLREKDEVLKGLKAEFLRGESRHQEQSDHAIKQVEDTYKQVIEQVKRKLEEEKSRHAERETELRIDISEIQAKLAHAEEQIVYVEKGKHAVDDGLKREYDRVAGELAKAQQAHGKERDIWKQSLQEIEGRLSMQKNERDQVLTNEKNKFFEIQSILKNQEKQSERITAENNALKNQFHNERDNWSQIAAVKDDQLQEMYEKLHALAGALKEKEAVVWADREKSAEIIRQKNEEIARIKSELTLSKANQDDRDRMHGTIENLSSRIKEKEAEIWNEKEKMHVLMRKKDDTIAELQNSLSIAQFTTREKLDKEVQEVLGRMEKDNQEWADKLRRQYEEAYAAKEKALRDEIHSLQKQMAQELEAFEHENNKEKEQLREKLSREDEVYVQEIQRLKDELQRKDQFYNQIQDTYASKENDQRVREESEKIEAVSQKVENEIEKLEHRFISTLKPKSLMGKLWACLNRTIVVISFRRNRRIV